MNEKTKKDVEMAIDENESGLNVGPVSKIEMSFAVYQSPRYFTPVHKFEPLAGARGSVRGGKNPPNVCTKLTIHLLC